MSEGAVEDIRAVTTTWPPIRIRLPGPVTGRLMRTPCTAVDARATDGLASSCRRGTSLPDIPATAPGFSATARAPPGTTPRRTMISRALSADAELTRRAVALRRDEMNPPTTSRTNPPHLAAQRSVVLIGAQKLQS